MPDYKAILSGQSWNALPSLKNNKQPVFLTYTFNSLDWNSTRFGGADKAMARKALKMWGNACGIRFLEVNGEDAELKFQWKYEWGDHSGRAEFPELDSDASDEGLVRDYDGGNIYMNAKYRSEFSQHPSFKLYIMLHEIGHALGLKHPFHKMPHNKQLLRSDADHVKHSVMSYTGGELKMQSVGLGALDIQAIRALYGSPSQDGKQVAQWNWSKAAQTLTQIGKSKADIIHGVAVKDVIQGGLGDDKIYGFDGNDILYGETGDDFLSGGDGIDILYGDIGNDGLSGGFENDTLYGGAGNDDLRGGYDDDTLNGDFGNDVMRGGYGNDILHGGDGDDYLDGGDNDVSASSYWDNDDTLKGGAGSDTLKGGMGDDHFVFDTWFNGVDDIDLLIDFDPSDDMIVLSSTIFGTLAKGTLLYEAFVTGTTAADLNDRIIFNDVELSLAYDPDGTGPSAAVRFAKFQERVSIYNSDILVV
ncbi:MAG: matrixin family metalloprotease [Microvirga sp.]